MTLRAMPLQDLGILYRGVAEKLNRLEIFDQPYLHNRSTDFCGTKTKLYREASSINICSKEIQANNFRFLGNMATRGAEHGFLFHFPQFWMLLRILDGFKMFR